MQLLSIGVKKPQNAATWLFELIFATLVIKQVDYVVSVESCYPVLSDSLIYFIVMLVVWIQNIRLSLSWHKTPVYILLFWYIFGMCKYSSLCMSCRC